MAKITFDLIDGLQVGDSDTAKAHKLVTLRTLTAGDLEDAALSAERVLMMGDNPVIAVSPTKMSNEILKLQILSIGELAGPLADPLFRRLSTVDLELIQGQAELLDAASRAAVVAALARGRSAEPAAGA